MLICDGCAEQKFHPKYCKGCQWAARRYGFRHRAKGPARRRRDADRRAIHFAGLAASARNQVPR